MENDDANEKLFCTVCSTNLDTARREIRKSDGDVQSAISRYLDGMDHSVEKDDDVVRDPIAPRVVRLSDDAQIRPISPQRRVSLDPFRDFRPGRYQIPSDVESRSVNNRSFSDLFAPPIDLLEKGTFEDVRQRAEFAGDWLLVSVQDPSDFQSMILNRDVWKDDEVRSIVKNNFCLWQVSPKESEGERFVKLYHVNVFPTVLVIDPRTGEGCAVFSDNITVRSLLLAELHSFVLTHPPFGQSRRRKRSSSSLLEASEEQQLAAAIRASLAVDRKRRRQPVHALNDSDEEFAELASDDESASNDNDLIVASTPSAKRRRLSKAENPAGSDDEMSSLVDSLERVPGEKTSLRFRFPNAPERIQYFSNQTSIATVQRWLWLLRLSKDQLFIDTPSSSQGGERVAEHQIGLIIPFPRRMLVEDDLSKTLEELALSPAATLLVIGKSDEDS